MKPTTKNLFLGIAIGIAISIFIVVFNSQYRKRVREKAIEIVTTQIKEKEDSLSKFREYQLEKQIQESRELLRLLDKHFKEEK